VKEEFGLFGVEFRRGLMDRTIAGTRDGQSRCCPRKEAAKMRTTIITLSAAALIAAAPAVLAQNISSKTRDQHHQVSRKHPQAVSGYAPWRGMHANGVKTGYPGASGYAPSAPKDYTYDNSRNAGGGGGGGGGSGM
jgi:hypothetical protein